MKALLFFHPGNQIFDMSDYLKRKSEQFYSGVNTVTNKSVLLLEEPMPVAQVSSLPIQPSFIEENIRKGEACLLSQLHTLFICDAEEVILSKEFSYLSQSFNNYVAGTIVVIYTTTFGTYYILFPEISVERPSSEMMLSQELLAIRDGEKYLYPIPMEKPTVQANACLTANAGYSITDFHVLSLNSFKFTFVVPDDPYDGYEWWGLYRGVMPGWHDLDEYLKWDYLSKKDSRHYSGDTITINDVTMQSGCIYTFALFKWKWDLVDYIEFKVP